MRLINTSTFELAEFFGTQIPNYAILTHTWGHDEVTYQDWLRISQDDSIRTRAGYVKIEGACRQARRDALGWLWVDTNCIDKSSSAELTEAINSMYGWYKGSSVCYAFMSDIPPSNEVYDGSQVPRSFRESRWFTRGWTLQELLAPTRMIFYSNEWTELGQRGTLDGAIEEITGIHRYILNGFHRVNSASIAERMSWLSKRTTTRLEDMAYCMLGIFDVNMPLLYGEGSKAFRRLQEEIIKSENDHTIFCWIWNRDVPDDWVSLLAPCPSVFADSAKYQSSISDDTDLIPFSMTNVGLSIRLPVVYTLSYILVQLHVSTGSYRRSRRAYICLFRGSGHGMGNAFGRLRFPQEPITLDFSGEKQARNMIIWAKPYVGPMNPNSVPMNVDYGLMFIVDPDASAFLSLPWDTSAPRDPAKLSVITYPPSCFDHERSLLSVPSRPGARDSLRAVLVIFIQADVGLPYGFFFVAQRTRSGEMKWHCSSTMLYPSMWQWEGHVGRKRRVEQNWMFANISDGQLRGLSQGVIPVHELLEDHMRRLVSEWEASSGAQTPDRRFAIKITEAMDEFAPAHILAARIYAKGASDDDLENHDDIGNLESDADSLEVQA